MSDSQDKAQNESSEDSKQLRKKESLDRVEEEKLDKSLDEVSNVIHDLISEPNYEDTEENIKEVISESQTDAEPYLDPADKIPDKVVESILEPQEVRAQYGSDKKYTFDEFIDERILISKDAFGKKEMKIKVLEVSDEKSPTSWKLGDRVKVNKILVTVKHLETLEIEEGEFDIQAIEKELATERHYSSTNRWVPINDIKNGYVTGTRHTSLISDAIALEYIVF